MKTKEYVVFREAQEFNIVYIEGACADGTANKDEENLYNDRRIVFTFVGDQPKIVGNWLATTEPGTHYIKKPLAVNAAAMFSFDQHKSAWKVGIHQGPSGGSAKYEGLVQEKPVAITRDINHDGKRSKGEEKVTGNYGLNQHKGSGKSNRIVDRDSAGCLVGKSPQEHEDFMNILKTDTRYKQNHNFLFTTTIIDGDRFAEAD